MGLIKYWAYNFKEANGWVSFAKFIIAGVVMLIGVICWVLHLKAPNADFYSGLGIIAGGVYLIIGLAWIPFHRHESETSKLTEQIKELKKQIDENSVKLEIFTTFESNQNDGMFVAWLKIRAVNNGRKTAKIRRAVTLRKPKTTTTFENIKIILPNDKDSEIKAYQKDDVIVIEGDGGSYTWPMKIETNPNFKCVERNGKQYGQGYVEFTNGKKIEFETELPPEAEMQKLGRWMTAPYQ